jgi:hypothetical protein
LDIALNEFQRIRNAVLGGDHTSSFGVGSSWTTAAGTFLDCKPPFCGATIASAERRKKVGRFSWPEICM